MSTSTTVHHAADIEELLAIGLTPITDNAAALAALGFTRRYPDARGGYEASVYERIVERGCHQRARERAVLRR